MWECQQCGTKNRDDRVVCWKCSSNKDANHTWLSSQQSNTRSPLEDEPKQTREKVTRENNLDSEFPRHIHVANSLTSLVITVNSKKGGDSS